MSNDEVDKLKLKNDEVVKSKKPHEKDKKRYSEEEVDWYTMRK